VFALIASVLVFIFAGTVALPIFQKKWAILALYENAISHGYVSASNLETGWDKMCVATPYCGGDGQIDWDNCRPFQDDGVWGVLFFRQGKLLSKHEFTRHIDYKIVQVCFDAAESPVFIPAGERRLLITTLK